MTDTNPTIFGKILRDELPSERVWEDEHCIAFRDIAPAAPKHVLVVPRKHIPTLNDITEADKPLVGHMLWVVGQVAEAEAPATGDGRGAGDDRARRRRRSVARGPALHGLTAHTAGPIKAGVREWGSMLLSLLSRRAWPSSAPSVAPRRPLVVRAARRGARARVTVDRLRHLSRGTFKTARSRRPVAAARRGGRGLRGLRAEVPRLERGPAEADDVVVTRAGRG